MSEVIFPSSPRLDAIAEQWRTHGQRPNAIEPVDLGEESVWDYPRPPSLQTTNAHIRLELNKESLLDTTRSLRVCETASAPTYYFWKEDFKGDFLKSDHTTYCEWKGTGTYWSLDKSGELLKDVAWSYEDPFAEYQALKGLVSFYPAHFETYLDGERVRPQAGGFYAGWVTDKIKGPVKGEKGSQSW